MTIRALEQLIGGGGSQPLKSVNNALSVTLAGLAANAGVSAYGYLRTSDEPQALFTDPLDSLDTTNRWTTRTVTGTATITGGVLSCASSTTAGAYGGLVTQPTFYNKGINFLVLGMALRFPNSTIANTARWIGWGTLPGTPTTTAPITDGIGFFLDGSGSLFAKIYSAGTEIYSANITAAKPADNTYTRAAVVLRSDLVIFYFGSLDVPVATASYSNPSVQTLPGSVVSIAGAVAPASSATIDVTAFGVSDTGKNAQSIVDPLYHWRAATVSSGNQLIVKKFADATSDWQYATPIASPITGTAATAMKAAAGANVRNYVTGFTAYNNSATASVITIQDGATVIYTDYLPANGSIRVTFQTPLRGTANTAMNVVLATTATSTFVSAQGYSGA